MSTASSTPLRGRPGGPSTSDETAVTRHESRVRRVIAKTPPELAVVLVVAALLNLYGLGINGNANEYYSAAVKSMTHSWSAFFFGTFDGAGLQTVDKPPLALWVQALSARIFGFGTWSFLVPQALMGVAAAGLTYDLVRRRFGRAAGFVAGFALATTPTAVAVFRHNNPDALLMLCSTLALWATVRAFESPQKTRWLVLAGVAVGLGFETKMATGLLVVPGIVAAWLWVHAGGMKRAIKQVVAFSTTAAAVGLAWPVVVWLIPAGSRPWISGTNDNSIWSLIFGYNGLGRVFGQSGGPGGGAGGPGGGGGFGGGNSMFGGTTGAGRLLNEALGSQGGWLLGAALGGGLVILVASRLCRSDARTGWLIATGGAFLTTAVAFSFASGIFHPYYVSALAPFTAALVGAGASTMLGRGALGRFGAPATPQALGDEVVAAPVAASGLPIAGTPAPRATSATSAAGVSSATTTEHGAPAEWFGDGETPTVATAAAPVTPATAPPAVAGVPAAEVDTDPMPLLRVIGGLSLVAGAITEAAVLNSATEMGWLTPLLFVGTIAAGLALVVVASNKVRVAAVGAAGALLLLGPSVYAAQTLGHATSGTFPTGGPASAQGGFGGGGGRGGFGGTGTRGQFAPPGGGTGGFTPPSGGAGGFTPPSGATGGGFTPPSGATGTAPGGTAGGTTGVTPVAPGGTGTTGTRGGGAGGGNMFGGDQSAVNSALSYINTNGGGTLVVSGQSGAAASILTSDAKVAGIGGFSGSESAVTMSWFANRVATGDIRWVLTSGGGFGGRDGRVGSKDVMADVAKTCTAVSSVSGLYDCQGKSDALRSAGS